MRVTLIPAVTSYPQPWCYPYPCFSNAASTTKVALVKETKHKANPATDEVRVENRTMVLPDHKAAITKQVKLYSKAITKGGTTRSSQKTHTIFRKH